MARNQDFSLFQGEDKVIPCVLDPLVDISGWTITMSAFDEDGDALFSAKTGTVTSGPASTFTFSLASLDTLTAAAKKYSYIVERTDSGARTVLVWGNLELKKRW